MVSNLPKPYELQHLFYQHCPLPYLVLKEATLQIMHANDAAASFFHRPVTQLEDICFTDLLLPAQGIYEGLKKLDTASGSLFFISCKTGHGITTAQVFSSGSIAETGLIGLLLTPAAKQNIGEQEKLMAAMVDESSDVLTAADLDFKPLTWSKSAERLYGITTEQALGQNLRQYITIQYHGITSESVRDTAQTKGKWKGEMSFVRPTDGKQLTLLITFKLLFDKDGQPLHYVISGTDISERKAAEAHLQESENRFREVADSAPVGIWMSTVSNKSIFINRFLAAYVGLQPETFTREHWISLIHPDDRHEVLKKFRQHFVRRLPVTLEYRLRQQAGGYRWMQDSGTPRVLSNGTFLGYTGSIIDIHDAREREAQLQYQATLMNHVLDSVITTDMDFVVQSCNRVAADVFGFREEAVIGKPLTSLANFKYIDAKPEQALEELKKNGVWKGEVDVDERNFLFTVSYVTNAAGDRIGLMAVGREITERKQAEKKLQESEVFYRTLIADSVDGKLLTTPEGTITFASPSIQTILGYCAEELQGRNIFAFVHPEDHANALTAFQRELAQTPEVKSVEVRVLKQDGTWLWCSVRGHNLLANPHIRSMVVSLHDDNQRKLAIDALKESEQRFRTLIKDLKLGVLLENSEGKVLMYNKATADLLRISEDQLHTEHVYDLLKNIVHGDGTPMKRDEWPMLQALRTRRPVNGVEMGLLFSPSDTERTWLLVNANPVLDTNGQVLHIISSFTDISMRKKLLQEQLNQQRLLTQATLDGQERERKEIGKELHDNIGQQLATTKLYLDLAQTVNQTNTVEMLTRAAKSISDVINEVRAISHSLVPPTLGDLGLVESVQELVDTLRLVQNMEVVFIHHHFCEKGLPENLRLMLYRVIQEGLNNIQKHAHARSVTLQLTSNSRIIVLQITDDGLGFTPETVRRGLGLSNIQNRAELFGGKLLLKAAPGAGCTLKIVIPLPATAPVL